MGKNIIYGLMALLFLASASGATLHGDIYDLELKKLGDVLVEINTVPKQQYLAKTGEYSFEVPEGNYILKARNSELATVEKITVVGEGEFVFDLFLFPSFEEEDEFLLELEDIEVEEEKKGFAKYPAWSYLAALGIFLIAMGRIVLARRKYGKLRKNKSGEERKEEEEKEEEKTDKEEKEIKEESIEKKEPEVKLESEPNEEPDHLEDPDHLEEPDYLEEVLKIIKKHDGRISQKELRKEIIHLSEAKISLILTELEHKGRIEKIKKGRGNVLILKE